MQTSMFDSYLTQDPNYIPDNMHNIEPLDTDKTAISQNSLHSICKDGEIAGYWWYKNDDIEIPFDFALTVPIEEHALIISQRNAEPGLDLPGYIGQRLYNIVDMTSWTMTTRLGDQYLWVKDEIFSHPNVGVSQIKLAPIMTGTILKFELLNFRYEPIITKTFSNVSKCTFSLTPSEQRDLPQGCYFLKIDLEGLNLHKHLKKYDIQIK